MRQWHVNPALMCRKHLLGEHVEHHMFVGSILKDISMDGYIRDRLLDINTLHSRHEEIVREMLARGMNHKSDLLPIPKEKLLRYSNTVCNMYSEEENLKELARRCEDCRKRQEEWKK